MHWLNAKIDKSLGMRTAVGGAGTSGFYLLSGDTENGQEFPAGARADLNGHKVEDIVAYLNEVFYRSPWADKR